FPADREGIDSKQFDRCSVGGASSGPVSGVSGAQPLGRRIIEVVRKRASTEMAALVDLAVAVGTDEPAHDSSEVVMVDEAAEPALATVAPQPESVDQGSSHGPDRLSASIRGPQGKLGAPLTRGNACRIAGRSVQLRIICTSLLKVAGAFAAAKLPKKR